MIALDHDPIADELLAAGWRRDVRDGWWRDEVGHAEPEADALRRVQLDRARGDNCEHMELHHAPDAGTDVAGALLITCAGCGWTRTASVAVRAA